MPVPSSRPRRPSLECALESVDDLFTGARSPPGTPVLQWGVARRVRDFLRGVGVGSQRVVPVMSVTPKGNARLYFEDTRVVVCITPTGVSMGSP